MDAAEAALAEEPKSKDPLDLLPKGFADIFILSSSYVVEYDE